jgi:hypothetical protein
VGAAARHSKSTRQTVLAHARSSWVLFVIMAVAPNTRAVDAGAAIAIAGTSCWISSSAYS